MFLRHQVSILRCRLAGNPMMASSVENRIALAFSVFKFDRCLQHSNARLTPIAYLSGVCYHID